MTSQCRIGFVMYEPGTEPRTCGRKELVEALSYAECPCLFSTINRPCKVKRNGCKSSQTTNDSKVPFVFLNLSAPLNSQYGSDNIDFFMAEKYLTANVDKNHQRGARMKELPFIATLF